MGSLSIGMMDNVSKLLRMTERPRSRVLIATVIKVVKVLPAVRTVGTKGSVTLTGGRALIATKRVVVPLTGRGKISVLPISDRRDTVFRSLRKKRRGTLRGVLLATSNKPFEKGGLRSLTGVRMRSTLGRPG